MSEWRRIGDLFDFEKGSLQSSKCTPGEYTFITAAEEWKTHNEFTHDCEALMFAMGASGSLGRTHYFKGKFISSDLCFILQPKKNLKLDLTFYYYIFNFLRAEIVKKTAKGTSKLAINQENFRNYRLPYFDYDHQLVFQEKLKNVAGITDSFNSETTSQLDSLNQLRQSVLQEAVEGKLTADWRKQHPAVKGDLHYDATALLAQIKSEKERLVKAGEIRKENPFSSIISSDKRFDIPDGWAWCRMGDVCRFITKGTTPAPNELKNEGDIPFLKVYNIVNQKIDFYYKPQYISKKQQQIFSRSRVFPGDVLMNIVGPPLGKIAIVPQTFPEWNINQALAIFSSPIKPVNEYLYLFLNEGSEIRKIQTLGVVGQDNISLTQCREMIIPLPPFAEQQAIVARVDSLMSTIDALEAQVTERKEQAQLLMQAVLREAFDGRRKDEKISENAKVK